MGRADGYDYKAPLGMSCAFCEETLAEHGMELWDGDWLARTYGVTFRPLPPNLKELSHDQMPPSLQSWLDTLKPFWEENWW